MEVLEYGLCGLREIRLIKEERVIGEFNGSTIEDFATSYTIQIRIPYFLFGISGLLLLLGEFLIH